MAETYRVKFHFDNEFRAAPVSYGPIQLIQLGDLSCGKQYHMEAHKQWCNEITYVAGGRGRITSKGQTFEVERGNIVISAIRDMHEIMTDSEEPLRFFYLGFNFNEDRPEFERFAPVKDFFFNVPIPLTKDKFNLQEAFVSLFNEFIADYRLREISIQNLVEQIIIYTYRNFLQDVQHGYSTKMLQRTGNEIVYDIVSTIDHNVISLKSLSELSDRLGYSYPYLSQIFSKVMGRSLKDYFTEKRIEKAMELIREDVSVTEISQILGYESIHSFSRAFKKQVGVSPSAFKPET